MDSGVGRQGTVRWDTWTTSRGYRAMPSPMPLGHLAPPAPNHALTSLVGSRESLARTVGTQDASQQRVRESATGAEADPAGWTVTQARLRLRRVGVASAGARARELIVCRGRGWPHPWITEAVAGCVLLPSQPPACCGLGFHRSRQGIRRGLQRLGALTDQNPQTSNIGISSSRGV